MIIYIQSPFLIPIFLPRNSLDGIGCFWYNIGTQQNKNMQTQKSDCLTSVCIFISQIFTGKNGKKSYPYCPRAAAEDRQDTRRNGTEEIRKSLRQKHKR